MPMATMNTYLGGDRGVALPAAGVSPACSLLDLGLLRSSHQVER